MRKHTSALALCAGMVAALAFAGVAPASGGPAAAGGPVVMPDGVFPGMAVRAASSRSPGTAAIKRQIQAMVDRETRAWSTEDVDLLLSLFHPDMVWPFPLGANCYDPATWIVLMPQFNRAAWRASYAQQFREYDVVRNVRRTVKIVVAPGGKGATAAVDVDTLWRRAGGGEMWWHGRAGKVYSRVGGRWTLIGHTGLNNPVPQPGGCRSEF